MGYNFFRMRRFSLLALAAVASAVRGEPFDVMKVLKSVETRYNRARTLQVSFEQIYGLGSRPRRTEAGTLTLRKPGRMRWDYREPAGKLFLSDGKDIWFYSPSANRVERMKLKESEDMRAPLAFLLGRLEFHRDFKEYRTRELDGRVWVLALPKSDKMPYREVDFLFSSDFRIERVRVLGQDQSVMEFRFTGEKVNPPLADSLFRFDMPPGAELVETAEEPGNRE